MKKKYTLKILTGLSLVGFTLIPLVSCGNNDKPVASNFNTDSWDTVAYYANQGIDALCNAYHHDANWFVDQKRKIIANNIEQEVRVIGINHDQCVENNRIATLTFQFTHLFADVNGNQISTSWHDGDDNPHRNYFKSDLYQALTRPDPKSDIRWLFTNRGYVYSNTSALDMVDSNTSKFFKNVQRKVNVFNEESNKWELVTYPTNFFVLTPASMYTKEAISTSSSGISFMTLNEDEQYEYYKLVVGSLNPDDALYNLVYHDFHNYVRPSFLASVLYPKWSTTNQPYPFILNITGVTGSNDGTLPCSIIPCFCL